MVLVFVAAFAIFSSGKIRDYEDAHVAACARMAMHSPAWMAGECWKFSRLKK